MMDLLAARRRCGNSHCRWGGIWGADHASKAEIATGRFKYYEDDKHREAAEELLKTLAEVIAARCTQVDLADPMTGELRYVLVSEGVLSVADYRRMVRYDWDYLSPDADDLPAEKSEG
jgi:hypothetical protein